MRAQSIPAGCLLIALASTAGAQSPQLVPAQSQRNADIVPGASWPGVFFQRFDRVAAAARLASLRAAPLPAGEREVRIWIGGGPGYPQHLYRITDRGGRVRGEVVAYWPVEPDFSRGERPGETFHDLMLHRHRGQCEGATVASGTGVCRVRFTRAPDWAATLRRAEQAGLWRLPDESQLPGGARIGLDGWSLTVELRDGREYRTYRYWSPRDSAPNAEERSALEIARALRQVDSLMRVPDEIRVFRGVTTGAYRTSFRQCGGEQEWDFYADLRHLAGSDSVSLPARGDSVPYYVEVRGSLYLEWVTRRWDTKYPRVMHPFALLRARPWTGAECRRRPRDVGARVTAP